MKSTPPSVNKFSWVRSLSAEPADQISRTEHHVAVTLAGYLNQHGTGFVTHAKLARDCRFSERTVCGALTSLADKGWLLRRSGKRGRATDYWTQIPDRIANAESTEASGGSQVQVEEYLSVVASRCGLKEIPAIPGSDSLQGLSGALARILADITDRPDDVSRLFRNLSEAPLTSANDPAAVLLHRLGQLLRAEPNLQRATPNSESRTGQKVVAEAIEVLTRALTTEALGPSRG
jgi:hypothetical protein